jgi:hypothetical protein
VIAGLNVDRIGCEVPRERQADACLQSHILLGLGHIGVIEMLCFDFDSGGSPYASYFAIMNASIAQSSGVPVAQLL